MEARVFYRTDNGVTVVSLGHLTGIARKMDHDQYRWSKVIGIGVALLNMRPFSKHSKLEKKLIRDALRKDGNGFDLDDMLIADIITVRYHYLCGLKDPDRKISAGRLALQHVEPLLEYLKMALNKEKAYETASSLESVADKN